MKWYEETIPVWRCPPSCVRTRSTGLCSLFMARLVMLPLEDHFYRAQESILRVLRETQEWLDRHRKHRGEWP